MHLHEGERDKRRTSARERHRLNSVNGERKGIGHPSVVLAESDVAMRQGIRLALESAGIAVAAEVESADALVDVAAEADVCLISMELPGGGIRAAAAIVAEHPGTAVIMLTGAADDQALA